MMIRFAVGLVMAAAVLSRGSAAASPILTLDPAGGDLVGAAGSTVGWGFTLTNDTDYMVVSGATFDSPTPLGTFTDFISTFNFFVVGPAPDTMTVSQTFNLGLLTGIGSFAISPLALSGAHANGQIVISYDLFSVSPNDSAFDPDADTISNGNLLRVDASVSVPSATVPEPATLALVSGTLGVASWLRRRRSRASVRVSR
jgi:hypothetical protein